MESNKRRRTSSSRAAALDERIEPSPALTLVKTPTPTVEPPTLAFKMHWTEEMERALIVLWKEIVRPQNGKGKNVWKTVASRMEIRFNGCGATDSACKNKFAALKSDYSLYSTMISESGFGGNMVNLTEPKVWQDYVQHFPKAATFRTNPFPHYETMKEVLGDEVFTGKNVTTADALIKKQKQDSTTPSAGDQLVLDQTMPVANGGILSIQEPVSLPAIDDGAPPMAAPHVQKEEPQMKKSDVRQDCVSRGVWKRPTKSDLNKEMVQSLSSVLKSSLEAALSPPAPTSTPSVLGRAVAYLQASNFATDKPVLWEIIKRLHADEKQAEILLSLGSDDLKEGYIRDVLLSNL